MVWNKRAEGPLRDALRGTGIAGRLLTPGPPRITLPALDPRAQGAVLALLAYLLLAVQDATVKWLVVTLPVCQVLFIRSAIVVAGCLAGGGRPLVRHAFSTPTMPLMACRGGVTLGAWFCYFTASRGLPLGQLTALYFTAPVVVTLLAAPLLGEQVGRARWLSVGVGFMGALLVASPTAMSLSWPMAWVLIAAVLWGFGVILTRRIARHERSLVQMFFNNCFFLIVTGIACAATWHPPSASEATLLLQVACLGGLGQLSLFEAARRMPASLIAPLEYSALVWAFVLGFLFWGDTPQCEVLLGAGLIVAAGAGLLLAEWRRPRPPASAA
jgi:drug/metabolite transporter (DMT)-like permease